MTTNVSGQIAELKQMTVTELRKKHIEAFGELNGSGHKDYLVKRIAWRLAFELQSPSSTQWDEVADAGHVCGQSVRTSRWRIPVDDVC